MISAFVREPARACFDLDAPAPVRNRSGSSQFPLAAALSAPDRDASEAFADFIAEFGLPRRLADVGVAEEGFELINKNAMLSIFTRSNPQPIREPGDVVQILKMAA